MPKRFRVVCTMQGAIRFTFTFTLPHRVAAAAVRIAVYNTDIDNTAVTVYVASLFL